MLDKLFSTVFDATKPLHLHLQVGAGHLQVGEDSSLCPQAGRSALQTNLRSHQMPWWQSPRQMVSVTVSMLMEM